jgi:hypothetical protein
VVSEPIDITPVHNQSKSQDDSVRDAFSVKTEFDIAYRDSLAYANISPVSSVGSDPAPSEYGHHRTPASSLGRPSIPFSRYDPSVAFPPHHSALASLGAVLHRSNPMHGGATVAGSSEHYHHPESDRIPLHRPSTPGSFQSNGSAITFNVQRLVNDARSSAASVTSVDGLSGAHSVPPTYPMTALSPERLLYHQFASLSSTSCDPSALSRLSIPPPPLSAYPLAAAAGALPFPPPSPALIAYFAGQLAAGSYSPFLHFGSSLAPAPLIHPSTTGTTGWPSALWPLLPNSAGLPEVDARSRLPAPGVDHKDHLAKYSTSLTLHQEPPVPFICDSTGSRRLQPNAPRLQDAGSDVSVRSASAATQSPPQIVSSTSDELANADDDDLDGELEHMETVSAEGTS